MNILQFIRSIFDGYLGCPLLICYILVHLLVPWGTWGQYTYFLEHSFLPGSKNIRFCFRNAFSIGDKESLLTAENPGVGPKLLEAQGK